MWGSRKLATHLNIVAIRCLRYEKMATRKAIIQEKNEKFLNKYKRFGIGNNLYVNWLLISAALLENKVGSH